MIYLICCGSLESTVEYFLYQENQKLIVSEFKTKTLRIEIIIEIKLKDLSKGILAYQICER